MGKWIKDYIEWLNSAEEAELSQARATQIHEQAMRDLADEASDYLRKIQDLEKS
ncbi:MAG: hypothetical protein LBQ24_00910 [Candidatus Peribacteria bacterium]|nr:hypothetical protein [Candidatus Peribacteria bacterium]